VIIRPTHFRWSFICGCASGSISAVAVNPADVVKTRLQLLTKGASEQSYNGIVDAFVKIFKQVMGLPNHRCIYDWYKLISVTLLLLWTAESPTRVSQQEEDTIAVLIMSGHTQINKSSHTQINGKILSLCIYIESYICL
jgi:hypothetical protein